MTAAFFLALAVLPTGHWESGDGLCLDLDENHLRLTQTTGEDRVAVEGPTQWKSPRGPLWKVDVTVEQIHLKHISRCRKQVYDKDLDSFTLLGAPIAPKKTLHLTLRFFCDAKISAVEVCRVAGACRVLRDESSDCPAP